MIETPIPRGLPSSGYTISKDREGDYQVGDHVTISWGEHLNVEGVVEKVAPLPDGAGYVTTIVTVRPRTLTPPYEVIQ